MGQNQHSHEGRQDMSESAHHPGFTTIPLKFPNTHIGTLLEYSRYSGKIPVGGMKARSINRDLKVTP